MKTFAIEYVDGRKVECESEEEAREIIENEYPEAVFCEWQWNDPARQRMLVWENEEIAGVPGNGDDGSHAVAEILMDEEVA